MASLFNTKISDTYEGLFKTIDNGIIGTSEKIMTDGDGNQTTLKLGTNSASFTGTLDLSGATVIGITSDVISVNGKQGVVVLDTDDISEGTNNLYFTEARVTNTPAVLLNTAKVGITQQQADDIAANNLKVGITPQQANEIAANTLKVGITQQQADDIVANNAKISFDSTGTQNYIAKWVGTNNKITDSIIYDTSTMIGIGTSQPTEKLHVDGNIRVVGRYRDSNNSSGLNTNVLTSTANGTKWEDFSVLINQPFQFNVVSLTGIQSPTNTATGNYSFAVGNGAEATAEYSVAMGYQTEATGIRSFAVGSGNKADGNYSVALGS